MLSKVLKDVFIIILIFNHLKKYIQIFMAGGCLYLINFKKCIVTLLKCQFKNALPIKVSK